ncbi:MAG: hypothetical protein ACI9MR_001114 [Myxococcota bacterium]|jgi:hypothetical protein
MGWPDLFKRTFEVDSLRCQYCASRLRFVSAIHDPTAIQAIIAAVHLADGGAAEGRLRPPSPARGPPSKAAA